MLAEMATDSAMDAAIVFMASIIALVCSYDEVYFFNRLIRFKNSTQVDRNSASTSNDSLPSFTPTGYHKVLLSLQALCLLFVFELF